MKKLYILVLTVAIFVAVISNVSGWDGLGFPVSISGDYFIWGQEWSNDDTGIAIIKNRLTFEEWTLTANDGAKGDRFGHSVYINGNRAIIGADGDNDLGASSGSAYIFQFNGTDWVQQKKLTANNGAVLDRFGISVCIDGDFAIVGAFMTNRKGYDSGSAYIFYYNGTKWIQQAEITANDGVSGDLFGWSVSINGNYALVGSPLSDSDGGLVPNSGSVYVFYYDGTNWVQQAKLTANDAEAYDEFGFSVSINGDYAFVGSYCDDDFGKNSGSVYVFRRSGTSWTQFQKITAYDADAEDWFGYSVSVKGNYAIVGSLIDDYKGKDSGSAYMYKYDGTKWALRGKLTGRLAKDYDLFGFSVDISPDMIIIGASTAASWLLTVPSIDPIQDTPEAGSEFNFRANIIFPADADKVRLYYRKGAKSTFNDVYFSLQSGTLRNGTWVATIPSDQVTTRGIEYYIEATDVNAKNIYFYGTRLNPYFLPVHGNITIDLKTTISKTPNIWNIVAPSVITDVKTVVGNFGTGGIYGVNWMAWRWNTSSNRWEVPQAFRGLPVSSDSFDVATSWWIMLIGDGSVRSFNIAGTSVNCQNPYSITLKAGWNNVANPFDFPVAWSDSTIRIEYDGQQVTPTQSKTNLWVDNRTFWYDNVTNQYNIKVSNQSPPYPMPPKIGFWLYSLVDDAKLIIYPIETASTSPPSSIVYNEEKAIWKVTLSLKTDDGKDSVEAIVSDTNSTKISYVKPPSMPFSSTRISIIDPNDDIELSKGISLSKEQILWHIKVDLLSHGLLIWKIENIPYDYSLVLEDSLTGKVYDLKQINSIDISNESYTRYFVLKAFKQDIPKQTRILANYPNPFNPETWIPFELSKPANVVIRIFSSDGSLIKTLELGNKPAGYYITKDKSAYWDGKNEIGEKVASGVYFYTIQAGEYTETGKMIMLK